MAVADFIAKWRKVERFSMQKTDAVRLLDIDDKPDNLTNQSQRTEKERLETLVAERTADLRGTLASLLESEERFHQLFERAPLGYQSLDSDGRFLEVNHAWLETLGYTREEVIGKWFGDFLAPEYVQAFRERFSVFKAEGKVHSEFFMMHKDGSRRYISFDGRIGHHADGSFKQTHCILKDETERKKVEHLLAESETRYKALHNASFGGIAIHDQGIILECNLGLSEMTGYDYSELIGMDGLLLIAERSREAVMKNIRTGYEKSYEAFGVRKNGEEFAIRLEARNVPYKGKQARTVEFRDITEHKQAEAYRDLSLSILQILNEQGGLPDAVRSVLSFLKERTGFDALGLRLQDGEDFPYFAQEGFSEHFLLTENTLAERGAGGGVCRDKDGKVRLVCTCGLVISGKADPAHPLFTPGGSFWTNDSAPLLALPPEQDPRYNPRNQCMHHGYASMALIPVRDKERIVGLLHLNDRRKGCFTLATVKILEDIAAHIGAALMRKQGEIRLGSQLDELRRWQNIMLDREDRVRELKREVNGFCLRAGEAARYPSQEDAAAEPQRVQAKAEEPVVSVEGEPRQSLDQAERSRLALLSAMEDQQRKAEACVLNAQRVESLLRLNRMIGATPQELMDYALEESVRLTRSEIGYLAFLNEDESVLTINSWSRSAMAECAMADKPFRFPVAGTGLWGEAVRQRRAVITNDYATVNPLKKGCPQGHVAIRRHMNVPVFEGSRIVIVAGVGNKDGEYDLDDVQELTLLMDGLWRLLEHRRADAALKHEQSLSKAIIDSIPGAFYMIDEYGRYVRWNAYQRDELVGKPEDQVAGTNAADTIHPEDRTLIQSRIENVLLNGAVETVEGRVLLHGGPDFRWLLMTGRRMLIDGHPFLVGIGIDIHAHKRDKAELQKLDKLQSVGTLAGGIAHDFNNILLGLFGNISIAMDDLPKEHPSYAPLEEAEKSMSRAVRLTKQLLTFAKGGTPVKEHVSLGDMVEEVARFDLTGSNVSLVYHDDADLWPVEADKGQIQQVVSNLVINARQAMSCGGHLHISLENVDLPANAVPGLRTGRYVKVAVRDDGCGIEPKAITKIFEPYFTTKQTGNGLGLATVWSIISKHGGHISVESDLGKGSTFTFYLPASKSALPVEDLSPAKECPVPARLAKILVMDDEDAVSRLVVRMLAPCGYSVAIVPSALETITLYKQALQAGAPFDAVIMDLTIPGGPGGKEAIKDLLALDPHVRAIVSSGYAGDPIMSDPAAYGFKGTAAKPYTAKALREAVARVLV